MIVDSARFGMGEEAAEIAAVLTERGLGGDSVDLDVRLDQFRRDRSQRASSARSMAARWASQVNAAVSEQKDLSTGVMLGFAFPDRVAKNRGNGSFVLANGRGAAVEQTAALARLPTIAVAELTGTAASGTGEPCAPLTTEECVRSNSSWGCSIEWSSAMMRIENSEGGSLPAPAAAATVIVGLMAFGRPSAVVPRATCHAAGGCLGRAGSQVLRCAGRIYWIVIRPTNP